MNFQTDCGISLRPNVILAQHTTMKVGGRARYFAEPETEAELTEAVQYAGKKGLRFYILGKGSNVVFEDEGFDGVVISFMRFEQDHILFDSERAAVDASAGIFLYRLALASREKSLGGMEFLANIPGTLGGALVMNAGFSRHKDRVFEIGQLVDEVRVMDSEGKKRVMGRSDLKFGYRESNLNGFIILGARLNLISRPKDEIRKEIEANFSFRNDKQDLRYPSSGSIFKNPPSPIPKAAQLIDQAGLKGEREGGIMVSDKHANYFVNVDKAKCEDIKALIKKIQNKVLDRANILLEPEIKIITNP